MNTRVLSCLALMSFCSPIALAQASDDRLDTVIVTTSPGPDRDADELIGNATVIGREDLVENLAGSLGDTLLDQPGVSTTFFGQGASRPVLRGLGADRVQVLTNGIGVIDVSAASPDHQVTADGIDAQSIEILRGPAALAYGGQAIGGVVNVIDGLIVEERVDEGITGEGFAAFNSVSEGTEFGGRAQAGFGPFVLTLSGSLRDFDNYDIPGFSESAGLRALEEAEEEDHDEEEGEDHDHEDEEEARDTQENSFVETQTLSAGLSWVGEQAFFGVAIRQQTAEYGLPGGHEHGHEEEEGEEHDEEEHEEEEEENPFIDLEQTRIDLRGGVNLGDGPITDVIGSVSIVDYEHTEFEGPGEVGTVYETEGWEGRLEADTNIAGFLGAVGVQINDKEFSAVGEEAFVSPTDSQSFGVFAYQAREWDSGVGVEGGLRIENVERENLAREGFSGLTTDFDLFSGSAGVHRHLDNGVFIGGQIAYTERAPSETELFADGPHLATNQWEVGDPGIDKETGLHLEGTARWSSENAAVGINLYITNFSDFIYLTPGLAIDPEDGMLKDEIEELPVFVFLQEDADFIGGEIYGELALENGPLGADWDFSGSVDFVEAELDGGDNVPFIPPVTFRAGTSAEWGAWEIGADLTIAGDQDDPGVGSLATDGYTQLDLRGEVDVSDFGFGADGTELFIEARNITDEEIRYATSTLKDLAPAPGQNVRVGIRAVF